MADFILPQNSKQCRGCKTAKMLDDFPKDGRHRDGRRSRCKDCTSVEDAVRRYANHEKFLAMEKVSKTKSRASRVPQTRYMWRRWKLTKFGLSMEDFEELLAAQDHKCAICRVEVLAGSARRGSRKVACLDHNHETGKVRGVLCNWCNTAIGRLGDDPEVLDRAAEYLRKFK